MAMIMSPARPSGRDPAEDAEPDRDASEQLDGAAQHREERGRVEMGDRPVELRRLINPGASEGTEQGAGAVVDEDPGQGDPGSRAGRRRASEALSRVALTACGTAREPWSAA